MSKSSEIGKQAEQLAVKYLKDKQYDILFENWRHKKAEIDIIAKHKEVIVFIEVKARKKNNFGYPENFVDDHKMDKMQEAADAFIHQYDWQGEIRFDIISIENTTITHFEDAFY